MKPSEKLRQVSERIRKAASGDPPDDRFNFLLKDIPEIIERRTRLGKGVENGSLVDLKPLSESYILARQGFKAGEVRFIAGKKLTKKKSAALEKRIVNKNQSSRGVMSDFKGNYIKLKEVRFKAKGLPRLSEKTSPKRSGLTLTGQMLSSIVGIRIGNIFRFFFNKSRDDEMNNDQLARYAKENGRNFFELSNSEKNGLQKKLKKIFADIIKGK